MCGQLGADDARRLQALVGVRGRHADVDHDDVGAVRADLAQQVVAVAGLADDLEAGLLEHPAMPARSSTESSPMTTRSGSSMPGWRRRARVSNWVTGGYMPPKLRLDAARAKPAGWLDLSRRAARPAT